MQPGTLRAVDEEEPAQDTDDSEAYPLQVHVHCLDDSQLVTLRLQAGSYVRFQVDRGAQCNVLPLGTYQEATGDMSLSNYMYRANQSYGVWRGHPTGRRIGQTESLEGEEKVPHKLQTH